ncbi:hypothetical protein LC605_16200 [Nostoc sp. CHAB 5836]|uniref:hypothetical protein n=1 Tax=Nostoc sp. CHAB 5836 TaxID=2780404 RepID=UPI001E464FC3|nr:hypothetical protein [Nostoc sp. CHAB 5836]MCC5616585.1 hypothetical protein [Nostoc sp. CHAB 5836]
MFLATKSMEIYFKKNYDALLFIVNNHFLFLTYRDYKDFIKKSNYLDTLGNHWIFSNIFESEGYPFPVSGRGMEVGF